MERTQEEVIKIFEEKQASAEQSLKAIKDIKSKANEQKQILREILAYEDCIAFLRGCTIVESHPNQDLGKKLEKASIEPYSEPTIEPLCKNCNKANEDGMQEKIKKLHKENATLMTELNNSKETIVELANEVTHYRIAERYKGV